MLTEHKDSQNIYPELDDFFNLSLDLLCIADTDGYFRKLNQSWETLLGYPLNELKDKLFFDFIHPDDVEMSVQALSILTAQKPITSFTNRYRHYDGSYRFLEWHSQPHGKLIYAVARDVTSQKEAETALSLSELRYRTVVTTTLEGIVLHDENGAIQTCNPAAERILGLTTDQMMGRTSIDPRWHVIHEDGTLFPGETHPAMITLRTGQSQINVMMGVYKPDRSLTWILVNTQPIFGDSPTKPIAVVASFTDITELKETTQALEKSEERFRTISHLISNYAYAIRIHADGQFEREWTVGAFIEITGYNSEDMDKRGGWASIIHPDDMPIAQKRMARLLAGEESVDEFRIITAQNKVCWIRDYAKPIWDAQEGRVTYLYGAAQNITSQKQAESQAQELTNERERVKLLSDFITTTSHELRNPLSVINTSLHLLMRSEDTTKRQEKAEQIRNQVTYLNEIINQLHEVLRLDRLSHIDLSPQVVETVLKTFITGYTIPNPMITLKLTIQQNLPDIQGDEAYIHTAITHLVENAMRFSPANSIIHIEAHQQGDSVLIDVIDNGVGIAPDKIDQIFDIFYKADTARTHGHHGAGLGLAMVKRIMQLHHGQVSVRSEMGNETVFSLHFPIPNNAFNATPPTTP